MASDEEVRWNGIEGGSVARLAADRSRLGEIFGSQEEIEIGGAAEVGAPVEEAGERGPFESNRGDPLFAEEPEETEGFQFMEVLEQGVPGEERIERPADRLGCGDAEAQEVMARQGEEAGSHPPAEKLRPGKRLGIPEGGEGRLAFGQGISGEKPTERFDRRRGRRP